MTAIVPALAMLAAFALAIGGVALIRSTERTKGILMIVAAAVLLGNVAIWTI
jgi:hypothetical protein